jgi:putative heme-binding domain-containing protein
MSEGKTICLAVLLLAVPAMAQQASAVPEQAKRGETLFFGEGNCSTCHSLAGRGTAVGPDLKVIARLSPRAVSMAVRSTRTQYVQAVKVKDGAEFPGMKSSEDAQTVQYYDLSVNPPELKKLTKSDVTTTDNQNWVHPPASAKISREQMADIVAYLRWVSFKDKKEIDASEVQ